MLSDVNVRIYLMISFKLIRVYNMNVAQQQRRPFQHFLCPTNTIPCNHASTVLVPSTFNYIYYAGESAEETIR